MKITTCRFLETIEIKFPFSSTLHNLKVAVYSPNTYFGSWVFFLVKKFLMKILASNSNRLTAESVTISCANTMGLRWSLTNFLTYFIFSFKGNFNCLKIFGTIFEPKYSCPWKVQGCRRFDGAIKGYGGCPMAKDDLVGNMPTRWFSIGWWRTHLWKGVFR